MAGVDDDDPLEAILAEGSSTTSESSVGGLNLEDILNEDDDFLEPGNSLSRHAEEDPLSPTNAGYTAQDWALLQQILKEDDDDDEPPLTVAPPTPSTIAVEGEEEEAAKEAPAIKSKTTSGRPTALPVNEKDEDVDDIDSDSSTEAVQQQQVGVGLWRISRLSAALEREQRLTKKTRYEQPGTASPLFLKRRARARDGSRGGVVVASRRAAASGRCAAKLETLSSVSRQLAKNAQYRAHGPGLPSALSVRPKFVAVGTSRGLTLVFDHFEEVRRVLGAAAGEDGVKCVDVSSDSVVACGHASGKLALWDIVKGSQIQTREKLEFGTPLATARFSGGGALVAIESGGAVHKVSAMPVVPKRLVSWQQQQQNYHQQYWQYATADCLLDETAGVSAERGLEAADKKKEAVFTSAKTTFGVSLDPARITHRWNAPNNTSIELIAATESHLARFVKERNESLSVHLVDRKDSSETKFPWKKGRKFSSPPKALSFVDDEKLAVVFDDELSVLAATSGMDVLVVVDLSGFVSLVDRCRCENACYFLGTNELARLKPQTASSRVEALIEAGEWLEALALALDENDSSSQSSSRIERSDKNVDLLRRYVSLAVDNAPTTSSLAHAHFSMLASVCVEFCVEADELDVLFGELFASFQSLDRGDAFLEALEPYIVNDKLTRLAPEVMAALVAHFEKKGALVAVERCLLHLDVRALDFNMITGLLKTHRLYTALFRVYSKGLGDYVTPLEAVVEAAVDASAPHRIIQQALLYIRYCLAGLSFPSGEEERGDDALGFERLAKLRKEIMLFLLQKRPVVASGDYGIIAFLAAAEPGPTLDVLTAALKLGVTSPIGVEADNPYDGARADVVVFPDDAEPPHPDAYLRAATAALPSSDPLYIEFVARHVARRVFVNIDSELASVLLEHLVRQPHQRARQDQGEDDEEGGADLDKIMTALPTSLVTPLMPGLLSLAKLLDNKRAELVIQRARATAALEAVGRGDTTSPEAVEAAADAFRAAVNRYCQDNDLQVFPFVASALETLSAEDEYDDEQQQQQGSIAPNDIARGLLESSLPRLASVDAAKAAELAASVYFKRPRDEEEDAALERAVASLDPDVSFVFVDALFAQATPTKTFVVSRRMDALYVELLAEHAPDRVYDFLSTHEGAYSIEDALRLCREKRIADAQAFLLELTGDSVAALNLILETLRDRFEALREALRAANRDGRFSVVATDRLFGLGLLSRESSIESPGGASAGDAPKKGNAAVNTPQAAGFRALRAMETLPEGRAASSILDAAVRLCRRHSEASSSSGGSNNNNNASSSGGGSDHGAWFATLDQLLEAKRGLQLSRELPSNASLMHAMLDDMVRRALGAMSEYVALPEIVNKLLVDHCDSNLGDFRQVIVSMLQATKHEALFFQSLAGLLRVEAADLRLTLATKSEAGRKVVLSAAGEAEDGGEGVELEPVFRGNEEDPVRWVRKTSEGERRQQMGTTTTPPPRFSAYGRGRGEKEDQSVLLATYPAEDDPTNFLYFPGRKKPTSYSPKYQERTRVPGMLETRAKFYGTLPPHLAPANASHEYNPTLQHVGSAGLRDSNRYTFVPAPALVP